MGKRRPLSKTLKRNKKSRSQRLFGKIQKGLVNPPNDKPNIGSTALPSVKAAADIKQENIDYEELHHEIDTQDELDQLGARKVVKRTPYSKRSKRNKRAMAARLSWKIRNGLADPPNDNQNIGPTVDKQDLKYLPSVNADDADIKWENFDYEELHHEIDIKDELDDRTAAVHSSEKLCACGFSECKTENGNCLRELSHSHESEKLKVSYLLLHKKIHRVKNRFRCNDCDFITDRKTDLIGHLNV